MTDPVTLTRAGNIGLICIDNPPVNALGFAVRKGIVARITEADNDSKIDAVVLCAKGRTFPAGADIKEFGRPLLEPNLGEVCSHIEKCSKPVIATLHGTVLGGGFEVALGTHFRIAAPGTRFGFPRGLDWHPARGLWHPTSAPYYRRTAGAGFDDQRHAYYP